MSDYLTPRTALLSAVYFLLAVILLFIIDICMYWFINNFVFHILNWFNRLNWFIKITILILGGGTVFLVILGITNTITSLIANLIFSHLPHNYFTLISTGVIAIANAVYGIIILWKVPENYSFWIICELTILSIFIGSLSAIVMPAKLQYKRQEY